MSIKKCPEYLSDIKQAITEAENDSLYMTCHSLKGVIGFFAADTACNLALKLEMIGRAVDLTDAEETNSALEREMWRLKDSLMANVTSST